MFSQTHFSSRMAAEEAIPNSGDGHLRWHAKRSADVFRAFKGKESSLLCCQSIQRYAKRSADAFRAFKGVGAVGCVVNAFKGTCMLSLLQTYSEHSKPWGQCA
jgi:hypothetical protein